MVQNQSLHSKLSEVSSKFPDKTALRFITSEQINDLTFKELTDKAKRLGAWLINQGIKKGERVSIILDNSLDWPSAYFGVCFSGATCVPLDAQLSAIDTCVLLKDADAKIILSSINRIDSLKEIKSKARFIKTICLVDSEELVEGFAVLKDLDKINIDKIIFPAVDSGDLASLIYTSGTTAKPKGVMLTHGNFLSNFESCSKLNIYSHQDVFISILPLFHAYAFMATLIIPLFSGATIVYPLSLKGDDIRDCMKKCSVTILIGVPQLFYNIHKAIFEHINKLPFSRRAALNIILDASSNIRKFTRINTAKVLLSRVHSMFGGKLRFLISGGARLDTKVCADLIRLGFSVLEGYGLTETSPVAAFNLPKKFKVGSVGREIPGVRIKIYKPDAQGQGEIAISGPNVMQGYFNRSDETKDVLKDGWFLTGDLGYIDKQGFIFITGRAKEVIVLSSGKNIYPEEIEAYYEKAVSIKELCVLETKDARGLDTLQAVVVPNFDYFKKHEGGNIQGKIKWEFENISHDLPAYKRISGFILIKDELARTRLGKIKRYEVRQKYLSELESKKKVRPKFEALNENDKKLLNSEIGKKIIEFFRNELSLAEPPALDDHFELDLGVDSLSRVELIAGIEKMFGISISDEQIEGVTTIRAMILKLGEILYEKDKKEISSGIKEPSWDVLLSIEPPDDVKKKIALSPGVFNKIFTFILKVIFFLIFKIFWRIKVEGRNNLSKKGPCIFYANHTSYLDGFAVMVAVPFYFEMILYFIGWKDIFEHPTIKWSNKMSRLVGIDSASGLMGTMQAASFLLKHKKNICMFPEGQRTIDGKIGEFKKGIGILVKELGVPVVPVYIEGAYQAWPRTKRTPKTHPIKVKFGKVISAEELLAKTPKDSSVSEYDLIAAQLRDELVMVRGK